jgi:hypothetical protein
MLAADPVTGETQDAYWTDEFFSEEHIIGTFQHLLHDTPKTVENLCRLCVAAREDRVVLAFSLYGLMPFANNSEFVFQFANMSLRQLQALRRHCLQLPDTMACEYAVDVYVLKIAPENYEVDHALLIFAAACLILKGLCETKAMAHGFCQSMLSEDKELLTFHANAIIFNIVNACATRRGALREAMRLLNKHQVSV